MANWELVNQLLLEPGHREQVLGYTGKHVHKHPPTHTHTSTARAAFPTVPHAPRIRSLEERPLTQPTKRMDHFIVPDPKLRLGEGLMSQKVGGA